MKMKLYAEDIGMYVSFGLIGAGIGALVGIYIVAKMEEREIRSQYDEPEALEEGVEEAWTLEELTALEEIVPETINIERVSPPQKQKVIDFDNIGSPFDEAFAELANLYPITEEEAKYCEKGGVDAVEEIRRQYDLASGARRAVDYTGYFKTQANSLGDKPDLDDAMRIHDNNGRYHVTMDPTTDETTTFITMRYHDNELRRVMNGGRLIRVDPDEVFGEDADSLFERVEQAFVYTKAEKVYVVDNETDHVYIFLYTDQDG